MKTLKISIDAPIIKSGTDLTHIATSWQVSKLPNFTLREYFLNESLNDTVDLLVHKVNLDIDREDAIYVRTKYHFTNTNNNQLESNWSDIVPLNGDQIGIKMSGIVIHTPSVKVDLDYTNTERGEIVITTTDFKLFSGAGTHMSTDWYISDVDGNELYKRENDEDNLTSIRLDTTILSADTAYIVKVKHNSNLNTKSNFGRTLLTTHTDKVKVFDIDIPYPIVPKRWVYGALKLYTTKFKSIDMIIKDELGVVKAKELNQTTRTPRIYTGDLIPYNRYSLYARVTLLDGTTTDYINIVSGMINNNTIINYMDNYPYLGKFNYTQEFLSNGLTIQNSMQHITGDIILGNHNSNDLYRHRVVDGKLINTGDKITIGTTDKVLGKPYINIIPLLNGDFIVDYASDDTNSIYGEPVFKYLKYNTISSKFEITKEVKRVNERYGTAATTSAAITNDAVYFIPNRELVNSKYAELQLLRLDIATFNITTVAKLPVTIKYNPTLIRFNDDELILIGGCVDITSVKHIDVPIRSNNKIYKYTISTNSWSVIGELPVGLDDNLYAFQGYMRRDKNIELFNAVNSGTQLGNQSTITLNMSDDVGKTIYNKNDYADNAIYRNLIMLQNGDMLRISTRAHDPQKVYTYVSNTYKENEVIDNTIIDIVTDLIVDKCKVVTIESPYRFETVKIEGTSYTDTGILIWKDGDTVHEFRYRDLLITRPTDQTINLYEGSTEWDSITILEDASLTIHNIIIVPDNIDFEIETPIDVEEITLGDNATLTII